MWFSPLSVVRLQTIWKKTFCCQIKCNHLILVICWSIRASWLLTPWLKYIFSFTGLFDLLSSCSFSNLLLFFHVCENKLCVPCGAVHRAEAKAEGPKTLNCSTEVVSGCTVWTVFLTPSYFWHLHGFHHLSSHFSSFISQSYLKCYLLSIYFSPLCF